MNAHIARIYLILCVCKYTRDSSFCHFCIKSKIMKTLNVHKLNMENAFPSLCLQTHLLYNSMEQSS